MTDSLKNTRTPLDAGTLRSKCHVIFHLLGEFSTTTWEHEEDLHQYVSHAVRI